MNANEIEFRGKSVSGKHWVYGYLMVIEGAWRIVNKFGIHIPIVAGEADQWSGLIDKNRRKIFTHHVFVFAGRRFHCVFRQGAFRFVDVTDPDNWGEDLLAEDFTLGRITNHLHNVEIIGNSRDMPALIMKEKK